VPPLICTCRRDWRALLPTKTSLDLVKLNWSLLAKSFWAVIVVFAARDAVAFVLHRISHRMTNAGAAPLRCASLPRPAPPCPALHCSGRPAWDACGTSAGPGLATTQHAAHAARPQPRACARAPHLAPAPAAPRPSAPHAAAESLLAVPISSFANPWWLVLDGQFLDANKGAMFRDHPQTHTTRLPAAAAARLRCLPQATAHAAPRPAPPPPCPPQATSCSWASSSCWPCP